MRLIRLLKQELSSEIQDWVKEDLISDEQAHQILRRYGIKPGQRFSLGYTLLTGLGFLFVGLSLITLIGANWEDIPRIVRMLSLIILTGFTQLIGVWHYQQEHQQEQEHQHEHKNNTKAVAFFFLGNLFYGASIILIAQIYHLGEHMPDGVFWWALGCLPTAVLLRSHLLTLQMMVLAGIWFFLEANLGFYPAPFFLFLVAAIYVLVRSQGSTILLLTIFTGMGLWVEYSLSAYWQTGGVLRWEAEHLVVIVSLFAASYGFSHWLNKRSEPIYQDYGVVLGAWCLRFILLTLLVLSFKGAWEGLITANWDHVASMSLVSALLWGIAIYTAIVSCYYQSILVFFILFVSTTIAVVFVENDVHALTFQVIYNFVIIGLGIWLIIRGISHNISHYFWTGVTAILATGVLRYFDLIGDYVGGAILFMFMAGILLAAARYWKLHQEGQSQ